MIAIQIKSREEWFILKKKYKEYSNKEWGIGLWNYFKEETCYIPEDDCFINLEKAIKLKLTIK